jgi:hypothetical protein
MTITVSFSFSITIFFAISASLVAITRIITREEKM